MKRSAKRILNNVLSPFNIGVEKGSNQKQVISLIQKLRPYSTGRDLIRLGPKGNGGYLVPNDLEGIEACFSPGVGQVSEFEQDCLSYGMKVFLADKSVDMPESNSNFQFIKKFVGPYENEDFITLENWVGNSRTKPSSDLLLQMDIEGDEYLTIISAPGSLLKRFRVIIVEFHKLEELWSNKTRKIISATFEKILQNHTCIHIHPNNCCGIDKRKGIEIPRVAEFTFIRNDRIIKKTPQVVFPHPLDVKTTTNAPIYLPKNWYHF